MVTVFYFDSTDGRDAEEERGEAQEDQGNWRGQKKTSIKNNNNKDATWFIVNKDTCSATIKASSKIKKCNTCVPTKLLKKSPMKSKLCCFRFVNIWECIKDVQKEENVEMSSKRRIVCRRSGIFNVNVSSQIILILQIPFQVPQKTRNSKIKPGIFLKMVKPKIIFAKKEPVCYLGCFWKPWWPH